MANLEIRDVLREIDRSEFEMILELYGVRVGSSRRNQKLLCPWHNDHNPSASIYCKKGIYRFHCYSCGADHDAVSVAALINGINGPGAQTKAAIWLQENGYIHSPTLASYMEERQSEQSTKPTIRFPISLSDLEEIGIKRQAGHIRLFENMALSGTQLPLDMDFSVEPADENDYIPVYRNIRAASILDIWKEDPDTVLWLLRNKAIETQKWYESCLTETYEYQFWGYLDLENLLLLRSYWRTKIKDINRIKSFINAAIRKQRKKKAKAS